ncbi:MAG: hypothetical protein JNG82_11235 [Opitutaceae bacterium]|nr:hypothetical protein [Opitutaceae bacterium]
MRTSLFLCLLALAGCQSAPQPVAPVSPPVAAPAPIPERADPAVRQRRHIEALIAQNEALGSRVRELEAQPKPVTASAPPSPVQASAMVPTAPLPEPVNEPALMPNAEGLLDLTAVRIGDEANPFAVRTLPPESVREIALRVGGIVRGPSPCALINGRPVQAGDRIESLDVVRIEPAAVLLRHGAELLRLPLTEKPVRLRLPL